MPKFCAVYGCSNRSNREKDKRYFRVPKVVYHKGVNCKELTEKRRQKWINNLRLKTGGAETDNARVCSDHFLTGCPSAAGNVDSPDWAPTVNLGYQRSNERPQTEASRQRGGRAKARKLLCTSTEEEAASLEDNLCDESSPVPKNKRFKDGECQADLTMPDLTKLEDAVKGYTTEICNLKEKVSVTGFTPESFQNDDKTRFYTGLPNALVLMQIFQLCEPYINTSSSALSKFEQFMMILMRLRLNLQLQDLAYRFNVSAATVSRICLEMIHVLHERLEFLIEWPEREVIQSTMPMSFRKAFGLKVAVILDCFEVFTEKPTNILASAQTWSSYEHHNTVKFLIGIAPQGCVTFISRAWGGRTSDQQITEECGILNKLLPGDIVLADRGFTVEDGAGFFCASLKTPSFTEGEKQLSAFEVEQTRELASVRVHVERVTGLVRRKYQILQSRAVPFEHMAVKSTDSRALVDKIAVICCALSNISESVVPLE